MEPQASELEAPEKSFTRFLSTGSRDALAAAFECVAPALLRMALAMKRDPEQAADLVQATFVTAIEASGSFDPARGLLPWMWGILRNVDRNLQRSARRQPDPGRIQMRPPPEPADTLHRQMIVARIQDAVDQLDSRYREVVALHVLEGLRPELIARRLGRHPGTVRTQLRRGLTMLRSRLPKDLAVSALACLAVRQARAAAHESFATGPRPRTGHTSSLAVLAALAVVGLTWLLWDWSPAGPGTRLRAAPEARPVAGRVAEPRAVTLPTPDPVSRVAEPTAAPLAGIVRARLLWSAGGPAAGVTLRLNAAFAPGTSLLQTWFDHVREATADERGVVEFTGVPPGPARLMLDDAFVRLPDLVVAPGSTLTVQGTVTPRCEIQGVVTDAEGQPVPLAEIWLSSTRARGSPGYVAGRALPDGRFTIQALSQHWHIWARAAGQAPSAEYTVARQSAAARCRLVLQGPGCSLAGVVTHADGTPATGATVGAFALDPPPNAESGAAMPPLYVATAADGRFCFSLSAGRHLLVARDATGTGTSQVRVTPAGSSTSIALVPGGTVTGRITDRAGRRASLAVGVAPRIPAASAGPLGLLSSHGAVTDGGSFRLENVVAGTLDLVIQDRNLGPDAGNHRRVITLAEREVLQLDLSLDGQDRIRGRVQDPDGGPLAGWSVHVLPEGFTWGTSRGEASRTMSDAQGNFELLGLRAGRYQCFASEPQGVADSWLPSAWHADATPGGAPVTLTVPAAGRATCWLMGRVQAAGRVPPAAGIEVCQLATNDQRIFPVDPDTGSFQAGPLPSGAYAISLCTTATHAQQAQALLDTVVLAPGERRVVEHVVADATGILELRVTRTDGIPVQLAAPAEIVVAPGPSVPLRQLTSVSSTAQRTALIPGSYELRLLATNAASGRSVFAIRAGETTHIHMELAPARSCTLSFPLDVPPVDEGRLLVRLRNLADGLVCERMVPVASRSPYRLALGLPPGAYAVEASTFRGRRAEGQFEVGSVDGAPQEAAFPLR